MAGSAQTNLYNAEEDRFNPRSTYSLIGHEEAERAFLQEFQSGKLPHAWLIAGPSGVGKATLAYRIARFVLKDDVALNTDSLSVDPNDQVSHLIEANSHSNLLVLSRPWDADKKRLKTAVTVNEVRKMHNFFGLAAGRNGWRVCIIDTADDLNISAANALLKTLEEPPAKTLILLLASTPGRLLPTIRSRCRMLRLGSLREDQVMDLLRDADMPGLKETQIAPIARLSEGSFGQALRLAEQNGLDIYGDILALLNTLPKLDEMALEGFTSKMAKAGADESFRLVFSLMTGWLETLVTAPQKAEILKGEGELRTRLLAASSLERWIDAWTDIRELERTCMGLHMDRKQTLQLAFQRIKEACGAS